MEFKRCRFSTGDGPCRKAAKRAGLCREHDWMCWEPADGLGDGYVREHFAMLGNGNYRRRQYELRHAIPDASVFDVCDCRGQQAGCWRCTEGSAIPQEVMDNGTWKDWWRRLSLLRFQNGKKKYHGGVQDAFK